MLSQSQVRNHINGRRPIGLQASLYEQSPWLERVRNTIWRGTKANATSSHNASIDEHHSRAAQSDAVSAPSYGSTATDEMVIPVTGTTPTFTVDSNAPQCLIQAPILANNASIPQGRCHNGMTMEDADLPAAGATPALPVGSFNALQHPPNPRNMFDAAESNHSGLLEDATSLFEEMVRHQWAGIRHNLETTMEDTEEDAHDGSSMDDEEECYSADENDMWNLTDSAAPREEISGISLEDKLGEHCMREAGSRTLSEDELALLRLFTFKLFLATTSAVGKLHQGIYNACQGLSLFDMTAVPILVYAILGLTKSTMRALSVERHGTSLIVLSREVTLCTFPSFPDSYEDESQEGIMEDIFDGDLYKSLLNKLIMVAGKNLPFHHFSNHRDIALGVSMDSVSVFKKHSKTYSPLLLFNYNLPPDTWFHMNNIIPAGIIPGPKKPVDMDSFLHPLVQELVQLEIGVTAFNGLSKTVFLLHAHLLGHNGFSPCRMCKIVGVKASSSNMYYVPLHCRNVSGSLSGPYDPSNLPMRMHNGFIDEANQVQFTRTLTLEQNLTTEFGIKGIPLLSSLGSLSRAIRGPTYGWVTRRLVSP
ncbi:hypothetical protein AX14_004691 [Amanita brunnescens Koide BX004]|nr:hypothetical protein AX14_004691 [Amanita brunnescens Koide BX004]